MTPAELDKLLTSFRTKSVLVVGDAIWDVDVDCKIRGRSPDSPTYVLEQLSETRTLGGAGCVYRNLEALGCDVRLMTFPIHPEKRRFWIGNRKVVQVDDFSDARGPASWGEFTERYDANRDILVIADYRHGFLTEDFARRMVGHAKGPVYVASQCVREPSNHHWYDSKKVTFVVNANEHMNTFVYRGKRVVTEGEKGAMEHWAGGFMTKALPVQVVDTCGAGDAFLAAYALTNDLAFSNLWAGLSVTIRGANPPTLGMLRQWVSEHSTEGEPAI